MKNVFPHLLTWNEEVLKGCGKDIDFVVLHFYAPFDKLSNDDKLRQLVWAGPVVFEQNLAMIRDLLKRHARSGVEICVTEYGTFFGEKTAPDPRIGTTENAVFSALLLVACMRASDVTAANHWSLLNNSSFGMLKTDKGRLSSRPTAAVIQGLASMAQGTLLTVKIDCAGAAVDAKGSIPALGQVPDLDGAAVRMADGKLRAALINRSVRNSARTRVRFDGGRGPRAMNVRALSPADAGGSEWKVAGPSKVEAGKDGSFELTVPPGSLVFIESIE
jgi:alpha-L-arabinofuranosidase